MRKNNQTGAVFTGCEKVTEMWEDRSSEYSIHLECELEWKCAEERGQRRFHLWRCALCEGILFYPGIFSKGKNLLILLALTYQV